MYSKKSDLISCITNLSSHGSTYRYMFKLDVANLYYLELLFTICFFGVVNWNRFTYFLFFGVIR